VYRLLNRVTANIVVNKTRKSFCLHPPPPSAFQNKNFQWYPLTDIGDGGKFELSTFYAVLGVNFSGENFPQADKAFVESESTLGGGVKVGSEASFTL
jgi:hypothetical protein